MEKDDIQGFMASEASLNKEAHVVFTYIFETTIDPLTAAATLCQETSTAQWRRPGVNEDFRPEHAAKLVELDVLEKSGFSAFYEKGGEGKTFIRARARIAHPTGNFGDSIPGLLTVAMGEGAFFSHGIGAIKLTDIEFSSSYLENFIGPRFGIGGVRDILHVYGRPIFIGVVKPNVGLNPENFAELAYEGLVGGLDIAKDDEMLCDPDYSPFEKRMKLVGNARIRAEEKTGEKKIFIANITHDVDRLINLHDIAVENGVNAVMVNVMAVGLSATRMLAKKSCIPIVAHFDCIAPMSMHPWFGVSNSVITKLERLCGCDVIIMPGFGERMKTEDKEVVDNVRECLKPMDTIRKSLPAPGGSDYAGSLPDMIAKIDGVDFAMVPGRGVFWHPSGPKAGAKSLRQAWDAVSNKISLSEYAVGHRELYEALKTFGGGNK